MPSKSACNATSLSSSPVPQQWQHFLDVWQTSSDWRHQWAALKKLLQLDREHFPGKFLPVACDLLSRELPHNLCWLKTVDEYGLRGVTTSDQAATLWSAWEHSRQRLLLRKWPDDNQLSYHLRAMSGLDRHWFPGRLRPFLFHIIDQVHSASPAVIPDWRVFRSIQSYMRHDTDHPTVWHQWHTQWQKLFIQASPDTYPAFFALESLLHLDEFHLPGIARPALCQWLQTFPHTSTPPWQLSRAMRRYTLQVAREGHDDIAYAWKSYSDRSPSHNPLAFQVLKRIRSRVQPETWAAIRSGLDTPSCPSVSTGTFSPDEKPVSISPHPVPVFSR